MQGPLTEIPDDLPVPEDDGGADHLVGQMLPAVKLTSTSGEHLLLSARRGLTVIFAYPMTAEPGKPLPPDWISIPGAAGCTLESCGFRDHHEELRAFGAEVLGLSTQSSEVQTEFRERVHLPFHLLSDANLELTNALRLPVMNPGGKVMIKRLTLICEGDQILQAFYPVFPPDRHAEEVLEWLQRRVASQG